MAEPGIRGSGDRRSWNEPGPYAWRHNPGREECPALFRPPRHLGPRRHEDRPLATPDCPDDLPAPGDPDPGDDEGPGDHLAGSLLSDFHFDTAGVRPRRIVRA